MAHTPSYQKINYSLRPAKQVERQMMLRAFQKLSAFDDLRNYRYVGFGSLFFVDFILMHRALGLTHLTSIENAKSDEQRLRFEYNAPFRCVDLRFGPSSTVLPNLEWDRRTITWLDYDKAVSQPMFTDIATVSHRSPSGSVLAVTMRADGFMPEVKKGKSLTAVEAFFRRVPSDLHDASLGESDVNQKRISNTLRSLIRRRIELTLIRRNALLSDEEKLSVQPLFFFEYADAAPMMTAGFVLVAQSEEDRIAKTGWADLSFLRLDDGDPFRINAPILTLKELRHLERQLPCGPDDHLIAYGIPAEEVNAFAEIHPFYPRYSEIAG